MTFLEMQEEVGNRLGLNMSSYPANIRFWSQQQIKNAINQAYYDYMRDANPCFIIETIRRSTHCVPVDNGGTDYYSWPFYIDWGDNHYTQRHAITAILSMYRGSGECSIKNEANASRIMKKLPSEIKDDFVSVDVNNQDVDGNTVEFDDNLTMIVELGRKSVKVNTATGEIVHSTDTGTDISDIYSMKAYYPYRPKVDSVVMLYVPRETLESDSDVPMFLITANDVEAVYSKAVIILLTKLHTTNKDNDNLIKKYEKRYKEIVTGEYAIERTKDDMAEHTRNIEREERQ